MSCQLTLIATFRDIGSVKKYLFPHLKEDTKPEQDGLDGWDDADWGWKDEDDKDAVDHEQKEDSNSWVQECKVSVSPTGELIAIANDDRLVLLSQKWDPAEEGEVMHKYATVFEDSLAQEEGSLHDAVGFHVPRVKENREKITSVLCLPLASQKRSTHGGPDWTCTIIGFSSGYVRIYTENGTLLLSQIFSEEPVTKIKCRTYEPPRHTADAEKHEEVAILYKKALVTIDGFSFFQSLRACRNQVARAAASGSEQVQPPPLAYKKWALQEQDQINDHLTCGLLTPNAFDQMQTGSILGGYHATIKATPPASHQYITAGVGPYVGFYYAIEGSTQPMLTDVAHAVASKLKSALFSQISAASGWLGLGGRQNLDQKQERKRPKIEPATALPTRFGLPDKRRHAEGIVLSPDNKLAAVTDSFGRVMLVEVQRGVALRMWKGYRDAQVGWVEVKEEIPNENPAQQRHAMFFIIYAPRRGILEVWTSQQGPRVAAFNVSKWCRLICPGYSLMGLNNVTCHDVKVPLFSCYLLDPNGSVRSVDVPFHLALSDKNSKRARDLHLLKKLKVSLKENSQSSDGLQAEVVEMLTDMKIASIRQQGLEKVLHTKYLPASVLKDIISAVLEQLETQAREAEEAEGGSLDYESRMLQHFCRAEEKLLRAYMAQETLNTRASILAVVAHSDEEVTKCLGLTDEEVASIQDQINSYHLTVNSSHHVKFAADSTMSPIDFISCFICQVQHKEKVEASLEASLASGHTDKSALDLSIHLKPGLTEARRHKLGNFLFRRVLKDGSTGEFEEVLKQSCIPPEDLMSLLLHLWLSEDPKSTSAAVNLHTLIADVTRRKDPAEVTVSHNDISPWWQNMRDLCAQSENIVSALLAALVGRTVASDSNLWGKAGDQDGMMSGSTISTDSHDLSSWESVTLDRTQWTVLIKQLEDLLALQVLLKMRPNCRDAINMMSREQEPIIVSVKQVLDGGRGVLPELVAKWISSQAILPAMLCLADDSQVSTPEVSDKGQEVVEVKKSDQSSPIVGQLQAVQRRLPHSLDSDILMANCAWEYVLTWNHDPEVIFPLQQAVAYLRCVQNAALQHGVAVMMWQMFVLKKVSAATFLIEKVGKAPKERLCRRDVGMSDTSVEKFLGTTVDLLDTILQASEEVREVPVLNLEDLWAGVVGPTSLVELALEQKDSNVELVEHHWDLCVILHAIISFSMKSTKPLSLFDTKGKMAYFKPLQSKPVLPSRVVDDSLMKSRTQLLCRIITSAVVSLTESALPISPSTSTSSTPASTPGTEKSPLLLLTPPLSPTHSLLPGGRHQYSRWPPLVLRLARRLDVEVDTLRRHHVCELYSSGFDKLAEEVLLTVSDHSQAGSQLMVLAGQRLGHAIFTGNPAASVDKLSNCPPAVSTWLKTLDPSQLRYPSVPLKDTATLIGQVVNQLPEGHSEYNMAISLVELVQSLM